MNTFGKSHSPLSDAEIAEAIGKSFDLRPAAIIRKFGLKNPIYLPTAAYGHFGRKPYKKKVTFFDGEKEYKKEVEFFTWEKLDAKDLCREICGMK